MMLTSLKKYAYCGFILGWIGFFSVSAANADYQDMMEAFNDTTLETAMTLATQKSVPISLNDDGEDQFQVAKKRLDDLRSQWERTVSGTERDPMFTQWDEKTIAIAKRAAADRQLTADLLKAQPTLALLEALTLYRSPRIMAARDRLKGAIESFGQVTMLDEILRQYTAFTEGLMPGVGPMKGKDSIKMKFPFPSVMALKGEIASSNVRIANENLAIATRDALTAMRKAFYAMRYLRAARSITANTLDLLAHLESAATTRYEAGKSSFQDVIKIQIKRKTLSENLKTLTEKQANTVAELNEILSLAPDTPMGKLPKRIKAAKPVNLAALYPMALENRQELRRMRAMIGKMERMIELAETMILPSYTLNLSVYEDEAVLQTGSFAMKKNFMEQTSAQRGAGIPKMAWYGTNDAYLHQTRFKLRALKAELKKMEASVLTQVRTAWFKLDKAKREKKLYLKDIIELSQAALDVSTQGYESGKVPFADVIASYTLWLTANLSLAEKEKDLSMAFAGLEKRVGRSLR